MVPAMQATRCPRHSRAQRRGVRELDYSEKYQPVPMREIQSEHFGKDASLSNQDHGRDEEEDMAQ